MERQPISIHPEIRRTSRNFEKYRTVFGYGENGEGLEHKEVLDVGAGDSDFARIVNESFPDSLVWRVDPDYASLLPEYNELCAVGTVQELPFPDDSFDEVISSWAVSEIASGTLSALREMVRVTKSGGKIKLFPVSLASRDPKITLPRQATLTYNEDPKKVYSHKTLEITKDDTTSTEEWDAVYNELLQKLLISEEDF